MSETVLFVQMLTRSSSTRCALFKTCHCFNTALKNRSLCSLITEIQTVKCSCLASCLSPAEGHSVSTSCLSENTPVCLCVYLHHLCRTSASVTHTHAHMHIDVLSGHRDSDQQKCCVHLKHIMSNAEITVLGLLMQI